MQDPTRAPRPTPRTPIAPLALAAVLAGVASGQSVFYEDFEAGLGGWSVESGVWEVGAPTAGPAAAFSGVQLAGTVLGGSYPAAPDSRLISPAIDLPTLVGAEELHLTFREWFGYGACDWGQVQVATWDGGAWSAWSDVGVRNDDSSWWSKRRIELTPQAGETVRLGFRHLTDDSIWPEPTCPQVGAGWFVDDVEVTLGTPVFTGDFENDWEDWGANSGVWQVGAPLSGTGGAFGGVGAVGTVLVGDYPSATDSRLVSPTLELPAVTGFEELHLRFQQWFDYGDCDSGRVQLSVRDDVTGAWSGWSNVSAPIVGGSPWTAGDVELTAWAGRAVRIGFQHSADDSTWPSPLCPSVGAGWYLDEIELVTTTPVLLVDDFENGWGTWSASNGVWQVGSPTYGPTGAFEGQSVVGTVLAGNYSGDTDSRLVSGSIALPELIGSQEIHLRFRNWFRYGPCDFGYTQISVWDDVAGTWGGWVKAGTTVQDDSGWSLKDVDLTPWAGDLVRIGFYHAANASTWPEPLCGISAAGWYIDDLSTIIVDPDFTGDFELGWDGWGANRGVWQVGAPTTGPPGAASGTRLAATNLYGNYFDDTDSRLISSTVTLPAAGTVELRFRHWRDYGDCDAGYVQIATYDLGTAAWSAWSNLGSSVTGTAGWQTGIRDLSAHAGQIVRIGFYHSASASTWPDPFCTIAGKGWYVDDVFVTAGSVGQWAQLGHGVAGEGGIPELAGSGDLGAGDAVALTTVDAAADAPLVLLIAAAPAWLEIFGGLLVPELGPILTAGTTDALGSHTLDATWPAGLPSGMKIYFQSWILDPLAVEGLAASNGLLALTP